MAEIGAGIIGAGAAVGAAVYSAAKGFVARHESIHTAQIAETQYNASSFEAAYERGDVYDTDWEEFLRLKHEARQKEREYDDSIQSYKDTPMYRFFAKIARRKHVRRKKKLLALVSRAVNLEELVLDDVNLYKFNLAANAFPVSLRTCTHLTTLSLNSFPSLNTFSALFNTIQCLPNVTTLGFCNLKMYELSIVVAEVWNGAVELSDFSADVCIPWDVHNFNVPAPVSYITGLKISLETLVDLLFLDIISSPKTPFPNVQEITLDDSYILQCRPRRLPALLERYKRTLRILDLSVDCGSNTPVLTLPGTLEHLKFAISEKTSLESFYLTLSWSSMLKIVTVVITGRKGKLIDTKQLDEVFARMVSLRRLYIRVRIVPNDVVERGFPRCVKRHDEGGFKMIWL